MPPIPHLRALCLVPVLAMLMACGQEAAAPAQPTEASSLRIVAIQPDPEALLQVGQTLDFSVEVEYTLGTEVGFMGLQVQDADGQVVFDRAYGAQGGTHTITLEGSLVVPRTAALHVIVPLSERGRRQTQVLDMRMFEVEPD